jgi:non-canonical purine NTP pyrophosphatase (RdgB/HAM1 family)
MVVTIVTTNRDKAAVLSACVAELGHDVVHATSVLVEPQADTLREVAAAKAEHARTLHRLPLIVEDSGLEIATLGGFPGPYTRYVLATLGARRLAGLAQGHAARFTSAIALVDPAGTRHEVELAIDGTITAAGDGEGPALWHLFAPGGEDAPFARLPEARRAVHLDAWRARVRGWLAPRLRAA